MNEVITATAGAVAPQQSVNITMLDRFIRYIDASPKTHETYLRAIRQMFNFLSAHNITQPKREDILAYKEALAATGHKPTTVQIYIIAARQFFKWTAAENLYPNIADNIKGAKLDREHKKDYLTSKQVKTILNSIDRSSLLGLRDYAIMCLMITGGLRTIEVSRANIEDMRSLGDDTVLYLQGKGHTERTEYIKLDSRVEAAIREYLKTRSDKAPTAPLFTSASNNSVGARLSTRSISGTVKAIMQSAGYDSDRLTAHSLRHTAVTLSLLAGKPIDEVKQFARHQSIETTLIYAHNLEKAKNSCAAAVAASIF